MSTVTSHSLHRHLLHHYAFLALSSSSPPPSFPPQQQPNHPFSSSNHNTFFPSDLPPPPPPPLPIIASFPANISSLILNPNSHSHHPSFKLILSISISALLLLFLLLALLLLLFNRKRRLNAVVSHKPLTSETTTTSPTATSDGSNRKFIPPTLRNGRGIIGTSTEFLYLGTVAANSSGIESPELRPLPPLPKSVYGFTSGEQIKVRRSKKIVEEENDDEFFNSQMVSKTASPALSVSCEENNNPSFVLHSASMSSSPDIENILNAPPLFKNDGVIDTKMEGFERSQESIKLKLKPLNWQKLRSSSDGDDIKSSSFVLDEKIIKSSFTVKDVHSALYDKECRQVLRPSNQEDCVISNNIAILMRALNVTADEVCQAFLEGNTDVLGSELLESLLKLAPSKEEELSLLEFNDESTFMQGPKEYFLRKLLQIPYAFQRIDAMIYINSFDSEVEYLTQSFLTLQAACDELKNSKMFLKLLEAVLKAGKQMNFGTNHGNALAFKLDTLLNLVDVKGRDGKTTLLHSVVQEIISVEDPTFHQGNPFASEDEFESRKGSFQAVTSLIGELSNVQKATEIDFCILSSEVNRLASQISKVSQVLKLVEEIHIDQNIRQFTESFTTFLNKAESEVSRIQVMQCTTFALVKEVTEYFHGNSFKEEANPIRIFMVVRDFLSVLDQVCKEVGKKNTRNDMGFSSIHSSYYHPNHNSPHVFSQYNHIPQSFASGYPHSSLLNYGLAHSSSI